MPRHPGRSREIDYQAIIMWVVALTVLFLVYWTYNYFQTNDYPPSNTTASITAPPVATTMPAPTNAVAAPKPKKVTVPPGVYTVGVDIIAGTYSFSLDTSGTTASLVTIYSSAMGKEDYDNLADFSGMIGAYALLEGQGAGKVELKNGYVADVTIGTAIFRPYTGLG